MIVCPVEKIGFMNIPKTATRSVLAYFQENMEKVESHGHRLNPPKQFLTDDWFRFAIIRNPYDRAVSYYWSMTFKQPGDRYGYERLMRAAGLDHSLKSWLLVVKQDLAARAQGGRGSTTHPFSPQSAYIEGKNVHQILHLENIDEEFNTLPFVKTPTTLVHMNHTTEPRWEGYIPRPKDWREVVGREEADIINELCAKDFEAFPEYEKI